MEDFCQRNGLEPPVYMALPVDVVDYATGGKIQFFIGQVIISSLRLHYITPRYYNTAEEAKVGAAETAVYNLHYNQLQLAMADLNGTLPTTSNTGGMSQNASTASLLPMVFPQAISNRNLLFSPLPCQSGLYPPSPGSLTPILPISTYDSGLPFQNLQMQSQLLDFQSSLISNPLLPCGGMIPTGALMVDPNSMSPPTTSTNGEVIADFKQKPSVNQINNGQSESVNFLPPLIPDLTTPSAQQTNISAGGSLNFRLPDPLLSTSQMNLNGLPVSSTGNSSSLSPSTILNSLNHSTST